MKLRHYFTNPYELVQTALTTLVYMYFRIYTRNYQPLVVFEYVLKYSFSPEH